LCDADEESSSEVKNSILTLMRLIWKLKEKVRVKNRATKCQKVRVRVKQVLLRVGGLEDVTMGNDATEYCSQALKKTRKYME
jgi:hypothetical protein